jgi:hypothetical protein
VRSSNEHIRARLLEPGEAPAAPPPIEPPAGSRLIDVAVPSGTPWGGQFGWIEITTRARPGADAAPMTHESKVRFAVRLFGQLSADPDTFRFGVKPSQPIVSKMVLRRTSAEPFMLKSTRLLTSNIPGAVVRVIPKDASSYELILQGSAGSVETNYQGSVEVLTDVAGEERIEIPIFGVVRQQAGGVQ